MKLPSTIVALFVSLLMIGCATKQQQFTPSNDPTKKWEKKQDQY
jgi:outer membrane biogenesis lipoprotein LolB